jgi:hypothetical protein
MEDTAGVENMFLEITESVTDDMATSTYERFNDCYR